MSDRSGASVAMKVSLYTASAPSLKSSKESPPAADWPPPRPERERSSDTISAPLPEPTRYPTVPPINKPSLNFMMLLHISMVPHLRHMPEQFPCGTGPNPGGTLPLACQQVAQRLGRRSRG